MDFIKELWQFTGFPKLTIKYCIDEAGITLNDIDYVVFYDKPLIKFEHLLVWIFID